MIIDNLKNCEKYYSVNIKFQKAFEFLKKAVAENLAVGKYEIDGTDVYANIMENITRDECDCKYEGHKNYIDIQFIASGAEVMKVADISKMTANTEYISERDIMHFDDYDAVTIAVIGSNEYAVFFPNDIHKPGMALNGQKAPVKKIVVKVRV